MRLLKYFLFFLLGMIIVNAFAIKSPSLAQAIRLSVKGAIGPVAAEYVSSGLQQAKQAQAPVVILELDTPGGLSKSMRMIIKLILASPVPVIAYVAPSGARAASAGTYILYATALAAMAPGTNIGAATPISLSGQQDDKKSTAMQKATNDAKAYIRALAQLHGRNATWAEQAVEGAASLSAQEALQKNVINFIAKDTNEVLAKADGQSVKLQNKTRVLHTKGLSIKTIELNWKAKLLSVIADPSVAYILLLVGIYGLIFEFTHPGMIAPGVVGAISLVLSLYALQTLPIDYAGVALLLLGIVLMFSELFIPSFGVLGIGGAVAFFFGSVLLIRTGPTDFSVPWWLALILTIVTLILFLIVLKFIIKIRRKPATGGQLALIGKSGTVIIDNNKRWVKITGELWEVDSGNALKEGQQVVVTKVQGLKVNVEVRK